MDEIVNWDDVAEVIKTSQGFSAVNISSYNVEWNDAKDRFLRMFGGPRYTLPEPITVHLSEEDKAAQIEEFLKWVSHNYCDYVSCGFADFVRANQEGFFNNSVVANPDDLRSVKKGMRLMKTFKEYVDESCLERVQQKASMYIQNEGITGYLTLSVHPLDFLSMSVNRSNWTSCYSIEGGRHEHQAATLAHMFDSSTIVCYLSDGRDDYSLPDFGGVRWNNKKWRMNLYVSDEGDALFFSRHYPFFCEELMQAVKDAYCVLDGMMHRGHAAWSNITDYSVKTVQIDGEECRLADEYVPMGAQKLFPLSGLFDDNELVYNDILYSTYYHPYYCFKYDWRENRRFMWHVGSYPTCPKCGNHGSKLFRSDLMICEDCYYGG